MEAKAFFKFFFALSLLLATVQEGWAQGQCSISNIHVQQTSTGVTVSGKPEFEVEVSNDCICSHSEVKLSCKGFASVEPVDASVFSTVGNDQCLLNNGQSLHLDQPIKFKYAQDAQVDIKPVSSQIACS